jgi:hypothetical protein
MLLIGILVGLAQAQIPPSVQHRFLSFDLGFTPVDYHGKHLFERRRKLEDGELDPIEVGLAHLDRDSCYEILRLKFITDPKIEGSKHDVLSTLSLIAIVNSTFVLN